jgi:hypothetical protein
MKTKILITYLITCFLVSCDRNTSISKKKIVIHYKCDTCQLNTVLKCYQVDNIQEIGQVISTYRASNGYFITVLIDSNIFINSDSKIIIRDELLGNVTDLIFPSKKEAKQTSIIDTVLGVRDNIKIIPLEENDSLFNQMNQNKVYKLIDSLVIKR